MKAFEKPTYGGGTEIIIAESEALEQRARLANDLMRQLAIATCEPDGCDEAGRQKLRLMTPEEIVARATAIAELAWDAYSAKGWVLALPMPILPAAE